MPANPTPSLAGTAETIDSVDVHILRLGLCPEPCAHADCERTHRILNTYAALAEKTAKVERLQTSAFQGAILLSQAEQRLNACEMVRDMYAAELTALRASLATAQEDARRLDFFQQEQDRAGRIASLVVKVGYDRDGSEWANICGDVRAAIDRAISAARPHATPEGE